jgi:bifunctional DNase/RNase
MLILLEIISFAVDPEKHTPVIILREASGERTFNVPVGPVEASAIAIKSMDILPDKPMTIDLVKLVMESLGATLDRVVIYDYADAMYLARLQIRAGDSVLLLQCATSDGLSLAIRCNAPIFATEEVFAKHPSAQEQSPVEALRLNISSMDTLEFGRYYLE